jgi:hypothetical protein
MRGPFAPLWRAFPFVLGLSLLTACAVPQPQRIAIQQEDSVVGFTGNDSMVTAHYRLLPPGRSLLNHEVLVVGGVAFEYSELMPGWFFTHGGRNQESIDLVEDWKNQAEFSKRDLKVAVNDVKEGQNQYGPFYFAVKDGPKGTCGYVRQVLGNAVANGLLATGDQRVFVLGCWQLPTGGAAEMESFFRDIMARYRIDGGALNKSRALKSG